MANLETGEVPLSNLRPNSLSEKGARFIRVLRQGVATRIGGFRPGGEFPLSVADEEFFKVSGKPAPENAFDRWMATLPVFGLLQLAVRKLSNGKMDLIEDYVVNPDKPDTCHNIVRVVSRE